MEIRVLNYFLTVAQEESITKAAEALHITQPTLSRQMAVSGVTLVNMFNTIFFYLFTALASGGAVIVSQYIGSKNAQDGNLASGQLTQMAVLLSAVLTFLTLLLQKQLLRLLFPKIEADVFDAALIYLRISAYSYPALALYNVGAALYRSMGVIGVDLAMVCDWCFKGFLYYQRYQTGKWLTFQVI